MKTIRQIADEIGVSKQLFSKKLSVNHCQPVYRG